MSSDLHLFILRCPDEQAWALSRVLVNWELSYEWDGELAQPGEVVSGDGPYTYAGATNLNGAHELANEIIEPPPTPGRCVLRRRRPSHLAAATKPCTKH